MQSSLILYTQSYTQSVNGKEWSKEEENGGKKREGLLAYAFSLCRLDSSTKDSISPTFFFYLIYLHYSFSFAFEFRLFGIGLQVGVTRMRFLSASFDYVLATFAFKALRTVYDGLDRLYNSLYTQSDSQSMSTVLCTLLVWCHGGRLSAASPFIRSVIGFEW